MINLKSLEQILLEYKISPEIIKSILKKIEEKDSEDYLDIEIKAFEDLIVREKNK